MKKQLDLENWKRKDHFHFFKKFEEPFFGLTVEVNCSKAYDYCKENNISFFLFYLYQSLLAANQIEEFRYRISEDQVFVYDSVHATPTIGRDDGTFGFAYIDFQPKLEEFIKLAEVEIARVKNSKGLVHAESGENVIHYSSIPWINFTSLSHARNFSFQDSCPKITIGKLTEREGEKFMPVSIHAHHALMDGFHVGQFIDKFQAFLNLS